jgi:hypothetical protein
MHSTAHLEEATLRLHRIQFSVRNGRWWEARTLLAEADAAGDWTALGHGSADAYRTRALGLRATAGLRAPVRVAG